MDPNGLLDVGIGLVLLYLSLSVFCTVINEHLSTIFSLRAKSLKAGIGQLIDDPVLRREFYDHGMIAGARGVSVARNPTAKDHPSYLAGDVFAMALLGSIDPTKPLPGFEDIKDSIKHLPDSNIRDALLAQVVASEGTLTELRAGLATWFDQSMERLSGAYKRQLKLISFFVGLVLALSLNADTIALVERLWHDGTLRAQIAQTAAPRALAWNMARASNGAGSGDHAAANDFETAKQALGPIPFGWDLHGADAGLWGSKGLLKAAGILLTTLAIMLGAPFWFDLLSKFMRIRGTGDKPAPSEGT